MRSNESRVKVHKGEGDFDKALSQGFAINLHECSADEMILVLPVDQGSMNHYVKQYGWEAINENA